MAASQWSRVMRPYAAWGAAELLGCIFNHSRYFAYYPTHLVYPGPPLSSLSSQHAAGYKDRSGAV